MMRIRVVTWNIHGCVGADGRYAPRRIRDVLLSLKPDLVGLQEVDWRKPDIADRDQFDYLAHELGMQGIEGPNLEDHLGHYGNGLLTRLPVTRVARVELAHPEREPRGLIDASVLLGDQSLRVLVTHLGLSRRERRSQFGRIREHLASAADAREEDGVVLMGDLNEWIPRPIARPHGLDARFASELAPRTFPARFPLLRLDRVLYADGLHAEIVRRPLRSPFASDHHPVCFDLAFPDPARR
jgi:endonuclease/exonuclease/phosphatase family metal-dependent hydrolase